MVGAPLAARYSEEEIGCSPPVPPDAPGLGSPGLVVGLATRGGAVQTVIFIALLALLAIAANLTGESTAGPDVGLDPQILLIWALFAIGSAMMLIFFLHVLELD
jgi:hypothetical protein